MDNAVKELVTSALMPSKAVRPFKLPRPTAPLVHSVIYQNEIKIEAADPDTGLEGVVIVEQELATTASIYSPAASINIVDGKMVCFTAFPQGNALNANSLYTLPGTLQNTNGTRNYSSARKFAAVGFAVDTYAWNTQTSEWEQGAVWAFENTLQSASHNFLIDFESVSGTVNEGGGVFEIHRGTSDGEIFTTAAHTDITVVQGTGSYAETKASDGPFTVFAYNPASPHVLHSARMQCDNVDITYVGQIHHVVPVATSDSFVSLLASSNKYCISALEALLQFEGGMTKAGHVCCALVPAELDIPTDAGECINFVAKLPQVRKYEGKIGNGAHVSWMPDNINQLWLRPKAAAPIPSQKLVFAFQAPPPGNLQTASMRLYTWSNVEFETYDPSYGASAGCSAGMLMTAIVDSYGTCQPCSENPNHLKKVADIAKKVVSDPTVQMFAKAALGAGKVLLPTFLAML